MEIPPGISMSSKGRPDLEEGRQNTDESVSVFFITRGMCPGSLSGGDEATRHGQHGAGREVLHT